MTVSEGESLEYYRILGGILVTHPKSSSPPAPQPPSPPAPQPPSPPPQPINKDRSLKCARNIKNLQTSHANTQCCSERYTRSTTTKESFQEKEKNRFDDILLTAHFLFVKSGEKHATKTTLTNKANSNNSYLLIM